MRALRSRGSRTRRSTVRAATPARSSRSFCSGWVITSGSSALQAVAAVREAGGTVLGVLAVVDRQQGGREAIEAAGVGVVALVTAGELGVGG